MTDTQTPAAKPAKRWMRYVLVLSLGLNLLVAGLMAGAFLRDGPGGREHGLRTASALGLRPYIRALADEDRAALMADISAHRDAMPSGKAALRNHLTALASALRAQPYDAEAVQAVMQDQAAGITGNIALGQQLLLNRLGAMTDAGRAALADKLTARLH